VHFDILHIISILLHTILPTICCVFCSFFAHLHTIYSVLKTLWITFRLSGKRVEKHFFLLSVHRKYRPFTPTSENSPSHFTTLKHHILCTSPC
jgi:hypothetical protein